MSIFSRIRQKLVVASDETPVESPASQAPTPDRIDLTQGLDAYRDGARFIDVREPHEWAQGHIAGAVHRPVGDIEADARLSVSPDTPVVTYCAAGARAARAAAVLNAHGYLNVKALAVGYGDWAQAGYPIERPADEPET
ncbi:rhodanese-like domain-containing protein [Salinisphaera aquimarina]|uniref:Rhodanese-like domain-containing protein n=1 Tax=Salinisphaera aquimarina TaxID=2094031 RepID=A0ABV7EKQ7_9GAMM